MRKEFFVKQTVKVVIDAGHGGQDPGAVLDGRLEKDDNLKLALAVGKMLSKDGIDVGYTRVRDVYQTPLQKAQMANYADADFFVSIHRNAANIPGTASGALSLVYHSGTIAEDMAKAINGELEKVGFANLGVVERPDLIVLRETNMPAVLVEAGFLDNPKDNEFFDENFQAIAYAIATGIAETVRQVEKEEPLYYQIQVGAYQNMEYANNLLTQLQQQNFPAFIIADGPVYKVRVGAYLNLDNAARTEQMLRAYGYPTMIVQEAAVY